MSILKFNIHISATPEQVWHHLWDDTSYRQWTAAFMEGSHAVSDWQQGSRIEFRGPADGGMYATIQELVPNQRMVFQHLGEIKDGQDQPFPKTDADFGLEGYELHAEGDGTRLEVTLHATPEWEGYFSGTFPKAIAVVKELAEGRVPQLITITAQVSAPLDRVWDCWTQPAHIMEWNFASPDWHCPASSNDLRPGGKFSATMAARDGSMSFDFEGIHTEVQHHQRIASDMGDGRKMEVVFTQGEGHVLVTERFQPENSFPHHFQRQGWQAILDNFKTHAEGHG